MSEKNNNILNRVATGVAWTFNKDNGKTYYSAVVDFGALGESHFFIFKRNNDKENSNIKLPDYTIRKSYENNDYLNDIGSLWIKEKDINGEKVKYLSGTLSAGVHGNYIISVSTINYKDEKPKDAPTKNIKIYISRNIKNKSSSPNRDEIIPF